MQRSNGRGLSACASCKHQRKKCTNKCVLAPFFPVGKTREFQAMHKVFGVSNITRIITNLKDEERKLAVDSLVWEALCRKKDPVLGPYGKYRRICEELRLYKSQYQPRHHVQTQESLGVMGWSNNNNNNNNKVMNNNNNIIINNNNGGEFYPYAYSSSHQIQDTAEKLRGEMVNGSSAIILPQQYILAGQFNVMGSKSMESTLWEGSS